MYWALTTDLLDENQRMEQRSGLAAAEEDGSDRFKPLKRVGVRQDAHL